MYSPQLHGMYSPQLHGVCTWGMYSPQLHGVCIHPNYMVCIDPNYMVCIHPNYMGYVFTPITWGMYSPQPQLHGMYLPQFSGLLHVQHKSIILCTDFPLLNALDFCGKPSMTPVVKHFSKCCCRIKLCSKLAEIKLSNPPLVISNAKAIANRPQSTAPFCR